MIEINLLPDNEKKEREIDKKVGVVIRLGFSIIFALMILSGVMLSLLMILNINLKSVKEEAKTYPENSVKETQEAENLFKEVNAISQKIEKNSNSVPFWGKILKIISELSPEGVKITSVHIEKEHVRLVGFSKTREDFLLFQERLNSDNFKNINSPVSNVVSPKDFIFTVEFDVEKNYLNDPS